VGSGGREISEIWRGKIPRREGHRWRTGAERLFSREKPRKIAGIAVRGEENSESVELDRHHGVFEWKKSFKSVGDTRRSMTKRMKWRKEEGTRSERTVDLGEGQKKIGFTKPVWRDT